MVGVAYTATQASENGIDITALTAAAVQPGVTGNTFPNSGHTFLYHVNASGSNSKTITFNVGSCNFGTDHDKTVTTGTSKTECYGPFKLAEYGSTVSFACGGTGDVTGVTIFVVEMPMV